MLAAPPETTCISYPSKVVYLTADEASCALREVAVKYMGWGTYDARLVVHACGDHWHLGRKRN